ncbi:MAG: phosphatase domain-containing protein [Bacteroidales bacterium]|nr:phosphatase domain-containing protein [Bacteroidales bacterium]
MIRKRLKYILKKAPNPFKILKVYIKGKLGWLGIPIIVPYAAYANNEYVFIKGAVIEDKGLAKPDQKHKLWKNILTTLKRYSGDEIVGVRVSISYNDQNTIVTTDERGIFQSLIKTKGTSNLDTRQDKACFSLIDKLSAEQGDIRAEIPIQRVLPGARFIIVSDIDDTVMVSHSTKILKKLRLMLFKNAYTRSPFAGVSAFYNALARDNSVVNPIFYVSSSEWNLYDLLKDFFKFKRLPPGTLLLSDKKLRLLRFWRSGKKHDDKMSNIQMLFGFYPDHNFILIGDSGQRDPEIYLQLAEMFPSRIKAIYIRCIGKKTGHERMNTLIAEAKVLDTEMILVHNTVEAARHAAEKSYINKDRLDDIEAGKIIDAHE